MEMLKEFWNEEEGMGTVEMILIIAALVAVALIFTTLIKNYVVSTATDILDPNSATVDSAVEVPSRTQ